MGKIKGWERFENNNGNIITYRKKGLKYPLNQDVSVVKSSDGWVVNSSGNNQNGEAFSKNLSVKSNKKDAITSARNFMYSFDVGRAILYLELNSDYVMDDAFFEEYSEKEILETAELEGWQR